jgi:hypothetical protein
MTDKNFVHNLSREYLQIMAFFSLGIIRMDNYGTGSVGTNTNLFLFQNVMRLMNV